MKNILKKLALLCIPVVVWFVFFAAFEPNNYFGLKASATSSQPVARSLAAVSVASLTPRLLARASNSAGKAASSSMAASRSDAAASPITAAMAAARCSCWRVAV